jgi:type II secretory pathway pseudopilin PulG
MLSQLVGPVDFNAALVLIVIFGGLGASALALVVKRRSRLELTQEFELAKIKAQNEIDSIAYKNETDRAYKFKQIDQGLITSHARRGGDED